jgi:L-threonine kinase
VQARYDAGRMRRARSFAYGSVGELLQGFTGAGEPFHVTLPASWQASCRAEVEPADDWEIAAPPGRHKMRHAARLTGALVSSAPLRVVLHDHVNPIPVGRGCASSTADVLATIRAVAAACGVHLEAAQQARLCSEVESSDGLAYEGMAAVNHQTGRLVRALPWTPQFEIVVVLPDEDLETSSVSFTGKVSAGRVFDRLLANLVDACERHDARAIAETATASALMNQLWVQNPLLVPLLDRAQMVGALGVAVAHTGTAAAWLFAPGEGREADLAASTLTRDLGQVHRLRVP